MWRAAKEEVEEEEEEGSWAGNKSKGQKNHLTTTIWAAIKREREREKEPK